MLISKDKIRYQDKAHSQRDISLHFVVAAI